MEEDKTQLSIDEGQPSLPDTGIQEQIKLDVAGPETLDSPVPERTTGNVIDISGDLIDKIMAEQSVSHEVSAPPEGGQEWEKPQEQPEPPRRGRRPKNKEAPAQGERPKRKGRPPKAELARRPRPPHGARPPENPPRPRRRSRRLPRPRRRSRPSPRTPPVGKKRRSSIWTSTSSTRSRITRSASGTTMK